EETEGIKITKPLISNVIVNLKGICIVEKWEQLRFPIWCEPGSSPRPSPYLAFDDGLVNLDQLLAGDTEGEPLSHDPRHVSPALLPYCYDPEADCPRWKQTLQELFPVIDSDGVIYKDRRIEVLQEAFGWCLLQGTQSLNLEKFFIFTGQGSNGKSTL